MTSRTRKKIAPEELNDFLEMQRSEAEAVEIYSRLLGPNSADPNAKVLARLSKEEERHYALLKGYTGTEVKARRFAVYRILLAARVLGPTFALKLLERDETRAVARYTRYRKKYPDVAAIAEDEKKHEYKLIGLLREDRLNYMGSVVLGLNDALVELTGALVGFTFALRARSSSGSSAHSRDLRGALHGRVGVPSTKAEGGDNSAVKASVYTGIAYILTVAVLVTPSLALGNRYLSLGIMFVCARHHRALQLLLLRGEGRVLPRALRRDGAPGAVSLVSFLIGIALKRYTGSTCRRRGAAPRLHAGPWPSGAIYARPRAPRARPCRSREHDVARHDEPQEPRVVPLHVVRVIPEIQRAVPQHRARVRGVAGAGKIRKLNELPGHDLVQRRTLAAQKARHPVPAVVVLRVVAPGREHPSRVAEEHRPVEAGDAAYGRHPARIGRRGDGDER